MTQRIMPVLGDVPAFEFQCDLEDKTYGFEFNWNDRAQRWFMTIRDSLGNDLISGIKLLSGQILNRQYVGDDLPPGLFVLIDTGGEDKIPDQKDLGERILLAYVDSTDVA